MRVIHTWFSEVFVRLDAPDSFVSSYVIITSGTRRKQYCNQYEPKGAVAG